MTTPQKTVQNLDAIDGWVNGGDTHVQTMPDGVTARSPAKAIADIQAQADALAKNFNFTDAGFDFATGGIIETYNQLVKDASGNSWQWQGALPHVVTTGTVPSSPDYEQRTFNEATNVSTKTSGSAQDFIDSFALKIFQSPTDGLTKIKTRTLLGGEVYEVRKVSDNSLATIYSDKDGLNPITQDGVSNVSGSDGVVEFFVADGDYYIEVGPVQGNFSTVASTSKVPNDMNNEKLVKFKPRKALFAWQFDGSYIANYTTLLPAVEAKGIKVGLGAIVTQTVGAHRASSTSSSFFTVDQLKDAYNRGHEVINHAWDSGQNMRPGNIVPEYERETWINESFNVWKRHGINTPIWITPNGGGILDQTTHLDTAYIPYILEQHAVAQGRTDFPHEDGSQLGSLTFGEDTPLNEVGLVRCGTESYINTSGSEVNNPDTQLALLKDIVDYAIENNRSVVFYHHDINNGKFPLNYVEQLIDYVNAQGGEWASNADVFSSFSNALTQGNYYKNLRNNEQSAVNENLLKTTQLDEFESINNDSGVGYTLTENSDGRENSSQYTLALTGLSSGTGVSIGTVIERPFDVFDYGMLTANIGVDATVNGALTCEIVAEAYDAAGGFAGGGSNIGSESSGPITINTLSDSRLNIPLVFRNFFSNVTCQSVQLLFRFRGTGTTPAATAFIFNPSLNRGYKPSRFIKKELPVDSANREKLWTGAATSGTLSLSRAINNLEMVEIEITGASANTRLGTKLLMFTSTSVSNREVVWFWGGSTVANATIIFDDSSSFRVASLDNSVITDAVVRSVAVVKT